MTAPRSLLPLFLATLYGLAIVYASLQPFANWMAPVAGTPYFLFAPWPPRWVRYDIVGNCAAYVPFGFFVGLVARRRPPPYLFATAIGAGAILSLAMETLQMYVPTRDASVADLFANVAGAALGGGLATAFARSPWATRSLASARDRWFLPGIVGDLGLALLAIWLVVQVNPGIPLFATVYDSAARPFVEPASDDVAATLVGSAHSAFQLLGVGLFVALLMRERRHVAGAVLLLIGAAAIVKGVAATVLLTPAAWEHWLTPAVALGVLIGSLVLALAIRLPRSAQVTLAAIALLSSLLATLFAPDLLFARAPVGLFNGPYGHLLNFNGLTHTVLLLWPVVASGFLFALAGRPGWGEPG
ncbi:MAG: VanZ family protein [Casimicrobiaceae bacterium]